MTRARLPLVALVIVALLLSAGARQWAFSAKRGGPAASGAVGGAATLSRMNSFALALLLGGLRGPLVMILWSSSETQKGERNLEDFDTKVEWIRLLQPEFDTVHIFQIWNKAYNISVQMASLSNKYLTILDALDYAHSVDRERPHNINILAAIAGVHFDKLGNSQEKEYYRARIRAESLPHPSPQRLKPGDPGYRRLTMDAVLDEQGRVLPAQLEPRGEPLTLADARMVYDGSELQFLRKFEPYPYGVSPFGMAYNYYKRCQMLFRIAQQSHAQLSDLVIDSRPALSLKNWAEEEWERARRDELALFGRERVGEERWHAETPTADIPLNAGVDAARSAQYDSALFGYERAALYAAEAEVEYLAHMDVFKNNEAIYLSHRDTLAALRQLVLGDRAYLLAMASAGEERARHAAAAREHYGAALWQYQYVLLRYYVPEELVHRWLPPGVSRFTMRERLQPPDFALAYEQLRVAVAEEFPSAEYVPFGEELSEYSSYIARAAARLAQLSR